MILGRTHSEELLAVNTGKNNIKLPTFHKSLSFGPKKLLVHKKEIIFPCPHLTANYSLVQKNVRRVKTEEILNCLKLPTHHYLVQGMFGSYDIRIFNCPHLTAH